MLGTEELELALETMLNTLRTRLSAPAVVAALSALVAVLGAPLKWS